MKKIIMLISVFLLAMTSVFAMGMMRDNYYNQNENSYGWSNGPMMWQADNDERGFGPGYQNGAVYTYPYQNLSQNEIDSMLYMREEEKLAHDVYITMYEKYGSVVFLNIANSESMHTTQVASLLEKYNITDPTSDQIGVFNNADLQTLYNKLIANGSVSLTDAFKVGISIEKLDIQDLQNALSKVDNADITRVYSNLLAGSYNHLEAFNANLNGTAPNNGYGMWNSYYQIPGGNSMVNEMNEQMGVDVISNNSTNPGNRPVDYGNPFVRMFDFMFGWMGGR